MGLNHVEPFEICIEPKNPSGTERAQAEQQGCIHEAVIHHPAVGNLEARHKTATKRRQPVKQHHHRSPERAPPDEHAEEERESSQREPHIFSKSMSGLPARLSQKPINGFPSETAPVRNPAAVQLFDALGIVPNLAGRETATEQTYFELNYTFYLNLIAFALSGFLFYVYRRDLGAPGQYRDPVCGMRTDKDGPTVTHDGKTYYSCSASCKRVFTNDPGGYFDVHPVAAPTGGQAHDHD